MSRVLTNIPSRLEVQIQSFVRSARAAGIENDFVELINGKQVSKESIKKLDNLINNILKAPVQKSARSGPWSQFKYDNLTNQNIVEFEIPRETRLRYKELALEQAKSENAQNVEQRARQIYREKLNNLQQTLISDVAQLTTQPTLPPLKVPNVAHEALDKIDQDLAKASDAERNEIQEAALNDPAVEAGFKEFILTARRNLQNKTKGQAPPKIDYERMRIPENEQQVDNLQRTTTIVDKVFSAAFTPDSVPLNENPLYRIYRARLNKQLLYKQKNHSQIQEKLNNIHLFNEKEKAEFDKYWTITTQDYFNRYPEFEAEYRDKVRRSDFYTYLLDERIQNAEN